MPGVCLGFARGLPGDGGMLSFDLIGALGSQKVVATGQIDFPALDVNLVHPSQYGSFFCTGILTDR